ncbi:sensor histidine kinase N-terminal domain-containing protein [Niveibacterium terrae]|uniref:sensor histidine kinase n=1 Tax=Niveibacterium terrae TaxID=3373598 RepID=UPI003A94F0D7
MALSLRRELLRRLLWPMLVVSLLGAAVSYLLALRFADETYDQWLLDSARALAQQVEVESGQVRLELPEPALNMISWDAYDSVLFRVDSSRHGLLAGERSLPRPDSAEGQAFAFYDTARKGQAMRAVQVILPHLAPGEDITVTVAETLNKRRRLADRVLLGVLVPEALLILLTLVLVRGGVKRGLRSIASLEVEVKARQSDDLTPLPDELAPAELLPFTRSINGLLERLNAVLGAQRRFIADAAHQLRTPLAALKVELEHAVREPDPVRHAQALGAVRAGIDRLVRISNQLLLLARAEPGAHVANSMSRLDLHQVVFDAAGAWVPQALTAGVDLGFEGDDEPCAVRGNPVLIGELVNNLIDNALRYGHRGGRITVRLIRETQTACLEVEDDGPGIATELMDQALDRFFRVPGSPGSGSGLGLAIVREIASAHGAQLELKAAASGGLCVRVRFPA